MPKSVLTKLKQYNIKLEGLLTDFIPTGNGDPINLQFLQDELNKREWVDSVEEIILDVLNDPSLIINPQHNDLYIVDTSPVGDWSGQAGKLARYDITSPGIWNFENPVNDSKYLVDNLATFVAYAKKIIQYKNNSFGVLYTPTVPGVHLSVDSILDTIFYYNGSIWKKLSFRITESTEHKVDVFESYPGQINFYLSHIPIKNSESITINGSEITPGGGYDYVIINNHVALNSKKWNLSDDSILKVKYEIPIIIPEPEVIIDFQNDYFLAKDELSPITSLTLTSDAELAGKIFSLNGLILKEGIGEDFTISGRTVSLNSLLNFGNTPQQKILSCKYLEKTKNINFINGFITTTVGPFTYLLTENILPGSEIITHNGVTLKNGTDYVITSQNIIDYTLYSGSLGNPDELLYFYIEDDDFIENFINLEDEDISFSLGTMDYKLITGMTFGPPNIITFANDSKANDYWLNAIIKLPVGVNLYKTFSVSASTSTTITLSGTDTLLQSEWANGTEFLVSKNHDTESGLFKLDLNYTLIKDTENIIYNGLKLTRNFEYYVINNKILLTEREWSIPETDNIFRVQYLR